MRPGWLLSLVFVGLFSVGCSKSADRQAASATSRDDEAASDSRPLESETAFERLEEIEYTPFAAHDEGAPMRSMERLEAPPTSTYSTEPLAAMPRMAPRSMHAPAEAMAGDSFPLTAAPEFAPEHEPMAAAAPAESEAPVASAEPAERAPDFAVVKVFYGTDRQRIDPAPPSPRQIAVYFAGAIAALSAAMLCLVWMARAQRRLGPAALALAAVAGSVWLGHPAAVRTIKEMRFAAAGMPQYGNARGPLELGTCDVAIPRRHEVGELEAPSILRLEVTEDPEKHVMVLSLHPQQDEAFFAELQQRVAASPGREALVFVHGYNVTFESAVRRTAQIAHDLKFPGAPIVYSWPSQGGLLQYTLDETNAAWTAPHLKAFLLQVAQRSGARSINLVAHSMGTRAMTQALREIAWELQGAPAIFDQLVLAAPDIDAEIFRRDIAPALGRAAKRVTLYASSDDQALAASRTVHGYARAGESGAGLVVTQGIDTIDVSGIDTSLLGHSYYGTSQSILYDLYDLVHFAAPPDQRKLLQPGLRDGLTYWILRPEVALGAAPAVHPAPYPPPSVR